MPMIWIPDKMEFREIRVHETPEGRYSYLILGLTYRWDGREKCLRIKGAVLVHVDMKYKITVEMPLYADVFEVPFEEIYEDNGVYYFDGYPIINYKMVDIPKIVTDVEDYSEEQKDILPYHPRQFHNPTGIRKYSINPVCTVGYDFNEEYIELYACVLSFDESAMTGSGVGFDALGKIVQIRGMLPIDELYKKLIKNGGGGLNEEEKARKAELGFLNLSYESDEDGNRVYSYQSIWDE